MSTKINAAKLRKRLYRTRSTECTSMAIKFNEGVNAAIRVLDFLDSQERKKKAERTAKPHKVTEVCNWCENAVTLYWDTKHDGYDIYCPCCGEKMKLSDAYYREVTAKEQTDDKES